MSIRSLLAALAMFPVYPDMSLKETKTPDIYLQPADPDVVDQIKSKAEAKRLRKQQARIK